MTTEKTNNKTTIGDILDMLITLLIMLMPIIFLYGIIALEIVANISYENNTNIDLVLFVIEYQTLLNILLVGALLFCIAFGVAYSQATNQMPWFLIPIILIALSLNLFTYKTPYVELQEKENRIIQDLINQGKITEESLKAGFFDEDIKLPAELAVCFDKKFEGELCSILFDKLLTKEKVKIEAQTKEKEALQSLKERNEKELVENYNKMLDEMRNEKHIEKGVR